MPIEATKSLYRRTLNETVYVRRFAGTGPNRPYFDTPARANVVGDRPEQLVGTINQYDFSVILLVEDLVAGQFALPLTSNDKLVVKGKEMAILFPDGETRSDEAELIAYQLKVKG